MNSSNTDKQLGVLSNQIFGVTCGKPHTYTRGMAATTQSEKRAILDACAPKIVDPKKYHGPAATDFVAIRKRLKQLENGS